MDKGNPSTGATKIIPKINQRVGMNKGMLPNSPPPMLYFLSEGALEEEMKASLLIFITHDTNIRPIETSLFKIIPIETYVLNK